MDDQHVAEHFVVCGLPEDDPQRLEEFSFDGAVLKTDHSLPPITDIGVVNASMGEEKPGGYELILHTPTGGSANLNLGTIRAPEMYLCYRRGTHQQPLVDIGVYYTDRERVLPDSQVVQFTVTGNHSANINPNGHTTFITYRRANPDCECNELVVSDICVKNKELAPHSYCTIEKNLNKGCLVGSEVYVCYRKSVNRCNYIAYKPGLLQYFSPVSRQPSFLLPSDLAVFAMPMGATLESWPPKTVVPGPVFSTFVLTITSPQGDQVHKVYCAGLSFYEPYDHMKLNQSQVSELKLDQHFGIHNKVYTNKCICIMSLWPFFDTFEVFLKHLHRIAHPGAASLTHTVPIERYIYYLLETVPFPSIHRPRILLQLDAHTKITLTQPDESPLALSGAKFRELLCSLRPNGCIQLLVFALTEQKLLLHSLRPALLTAAAEALTMVIFPFHWQCTYVPLCPLGLSSLLSAPIPFLLGLDSRFFDIYHPPHDIICVDLDTGAIFIPEDKRGLNEKMLPRRPLKLLRSSLENLCLKISDFDRYREQYILRQMRSPDESAIDTDFKIKKMEHELEVEIQEAFLIFTAGLLSGYSSFLLPILSQNASPNTSTLFDLDGFVKSRERSYQKFYLHLVNTQMFSKFIEERSFVSNKDASLAFFDDCVEKVSRLSSSTYNQVNGVVDGRPVERLLEVESTSGDHTSLVPPPEPPPNVNPDQTWSYTGFPVLDPALYSTSQPALHCLDTPVPAQGSVPPPSPMARRSKLEVKSAQKLAKRYAESPLVWVKFLLSTSYSVWFTQLPSLALYWQQQQRGGRRVLQLGYRVLLHIQTFFGQNTDEVTYRMMMQLCGLYCQPVLAVQILCAMNALKITPNAITYGYYNRAVVAGNWQRTTQNWKKLRNLVRGVAAFRSSGRDRCERHRAPSAAAILKAVKAASLEAEESSKLLGETKGQAPCAPGMKDNVDGRAGNQRSSEAQAADQGYFSITDQTDANCKGDNGTVINKVIFTLGASDPSDCDRNSHPKTHPEEEPSASLSNSIKVASIAGTASKDGLVSEPPLACVMASTTLPVEHSAGLVMTTPLDDAVFQPSQRHRSRPTDLAHSLMPTLNNYDQMSESMLVRPIDASSDYLRSSAVGGDSHIINKLWNIASSYIPSYQATEGTSQNNTPLHSATNTPRRQPSIRRIHTTGDSLGDRWEKSVERWDSAASSPKIERSKASSDKLKMTDPVRSGHVRTGSGSSLGSCGGIEASVSKSVPCNNISSSHSSSVLVNNKFLAKNGAILSETGHDQKDANCNGFKSITKIYSSELSNESPCCVGDDEDPLISKGFNHSSENKGQSENSLSDIVEEGHQSSQNGTGLLHQRNFFSRNAPERLSNIIKRGVGGADEKLRGFLRKGMSRSSSKDSMSSVTSSDVGTAEGSVVSSPSGEYFESSVGKNETINLAQKFESPTKLKSKNKERIMGKFTKSSTDLKLFSLKEQPRLFRQESSEEHKTPPISPDKSVQSNIAVSKPQFSTASQPVTVPVCPGREKVILGDPLGALDSPTSSPSRSENAPRKSRSLELNPQRHDLSVESEVSKRSSFENNTSHSGLKPELKLKVSTVRRTLLAPLTSASDEGVKRETRTSPKKKSPVKFPTKAFTNSVNKENCLSSTQMDKSLVSPPVKTTLSSVLNVPKGTGELHQSASHALSYKPVENPSPSPIVPVPWSVIPIGSPFAMSVPFVVPENYNANMNNGQSTLQEMRPENEQSVKRDGSDNFEQSTIDDPLQKILVANPKNLPPVPPKVTNRAASSDVLGRSSRSISRKPSGGSGRSSSANNLGEVQHCSNNGTLDNVVSDRNLRQPKWVPHSGEINVARQPRGVLDSYEDMKRNSNSLTSLSSAVSDSDVLSIPNGNRRGSDQPSHRCQRATRYAATLESNHSPAASRSNRWISMEQGYYMSSSATLSNLASSGLQKLENIRENYLDSTVGEFLSGSGLTATRRGELLSGGLSSVKSAVSSFSKRFRQSISANTTPTRATQGEINSRSSPPPPGFFEFWWRNFDMGGGEEDAVDGLFSWVRRDSSATDLIPGGVSGSDELLMSHALASSLGGQAFSAATGSGLLSDALNCGSMGSGQLLEAFSDAGSSWESTGPYCMAVAITSCSKCHNCRTLLYDEEIMTGWSANDSNLNTQCRYCARRTVPVLTITLYDMLHIDKQDAPGADIDRRKSSSAPEDGSSRICSRSKEEIYKTVHNKIRGSEPFTVAYLSPLVLRKELETMVTHEGDESLTLASYPEKHPILFWNMLWYFTRLGLPSQLAGLYLSGYLASNMEKLHPSWRSSSYCKGPSPRDTTVGHETIPTVGKSRSEIPSLSAETDDKLLSYSLHESMSERDSATNNTSSGHMVHSPTNCVYDNSTISNEVCVSKQFVNTEAENCLVDSESILKSTDMPYQSSEYVGCDERRTRTAIMTLTYEGVDCETDSLVQDLKKNAVGVNNAADSFSEEKMKPSVQLGGDLESESVAASASVSRRPSFCSSSALPDWRNIFVICLWDNPLYHQDVGPPLYVQRRQFGQESQLVQAIVNNPLLISKNVLQNLFTCLSLEDLSSAMQTFAKELRKRPTKLQQHRLPLYRDFLLLASDGLGASRSINMVTFDQKYRAAYDNLDASTAALFTPADAAPPFTANFAKRCFPPLAL